MKIYYRISNNSYKKNRLSNATKQHCLDNFLAEFDFPENDILIAADNVTEPALMSFIRSKEKSNIKIEETKLNNAHTFRHCMRKCCETIGDKDTAYFVEDDYFHLPNSFKLLKEGLSVSNYATLYDHPDKYIDANMGGNPQIDGGGEITRVVLTKSIHWKLTNSVTMTFAVNGDVIKKDKDIWEKYLLTSYPRDYEACCELVQIYNRSIVSCIPGKSTHSEIPWLTPLVDWAKI
jgi:hypothetical protein